MIKAVYEDGRIVPTDPVPAEWHDGQELEIAEVPGEDVDESERLRRIDEWYRDIERLAQELDEEDFRRIEETLREADVIAKEQVRREMGIPR